MEYSYKTIDLSTTKGIKLGFKLLAAGYTILSHGFNIANFRKLKR